MERFNRTVQEECLDKLKPIPAVFNLALQTYVPFYNNERHHFGLKLETPLSTIKCFQGID